MSTRKVFFRAATDRNRIQKKQILLHWGGMQRHISLILGLIITFGLVLLLVAAVRSGTLSLGAAADFLNLR